MTPTRKPQPFHLRPTDRKTLKAMLSKGHVESVRVIQRVQALLALDEGKGPVEVSRATRISNRTVERLRARYWSEGLERALGDNWNSLTPKLLSQRQEAEIIAMVCGPVPQGRARWTHRLIAKEAVARGICERVGETTVGVLLQSHGLKPWREKNVVRFRSYAGIRGKDGRRLGPLRETPRSH